MEPSATHKPPGNSPQDLRSSADSIRELQSSAESLRASGPDTARSTPTSRTQDAEWHGMHGLLVSKDLRTSETAGDLRTSEAGGDLRTSEAGGESDTPSPSSDTPTSPWLMNLGGLL